MPGPLGDLARRAVARPVLRLSSERCIDRHGRLPRTLLMGITVSRRAECRLNRVDRAEGQGGHWPRPAPAYRRGRERAGPFHRDPLHGEWPRPSSAPWSSACGTMAVASLGTEPFGRRPRGTPCCPRSRRRDARSPPRPTTRMRLVANNGKRLTLASDRALLCYGVTSASVLPPCSFEERA
jgi:hypothetical protein